MTNNIVALVNKHELDEYHQLFEERSWPNANISFDPADIPQANILYGEPDLIIPYFPAAEKLVWLQSTWAGGEPFLKPEVRKDYTLTNARGIFGRTIAEYTLTYILAHERNLFAHAESQTRQAWEPILTGRLRNKTLGIVGVGSIGEVVAQLFKGLGLTVLGYTRSSQNSVDVDQYFHPPSGLTEMAAACDYILNVMPSTPASTNLLNASIFKAMRP
ncbi:MAG: NAD(P)-dependent oxidoreductase, partial [Chloroflexota bacterium]